MTDLEATVAYLKDRQDILDCIVRECRARDRQDTAQIASCWWEDGVDEHGAVVTVAPDYPERANAGHRGAFQATSHNITNHLCEIDGTVANCETYVVGGLFWKDRRRPRSPLAAISTGWRSAAANGASWSVAAPSR
ncbi:nuclear transport factor 2 family protein [Novosphingobium panipatense]